MPGEQVVLADDVSGRISSFVAAIERFPTKPQWAVVGGFAVNVRIAHAHRLTNDLDTVSRDHLRLVDILVNEEGAQRLATAKLILDLEGTSVHIDVMSDTADVDLPAEPSDRAFALARRMAIEDAELVELIVVLGSEMIAASVAPVASVAALVALKSVALTRRTRSNSPAKVGSDIHDLVRLAMGSQLDVIAHEIAAHDQELCDWLSGTLIKWFSPEHDLRYTHARLRRLDGSFGAQSLVESDLAVLSELGEALASP